MGWDGVDDILSIFYLYLEISRDMRGGGEESITKKKNFPSSLPSLPCVSVFFFFIRIASYHLYGV